MERGEISLADRTAQLKHLSMFKPCLLVEQKEIGVMEKYGM